MRIVFVSEHDQCRGPMARALADRLARTQGLDGSVFDSCGVAAQDGNQPTVEAASFLRMENINILTHTAKSLSPAIADSADILFCLTAAVLRETKKIIGPVLAPKAVLLNDAIDLATKKLDIEPPTDSSVAALRRLYASLGASMGRLVRTLDDAEAGPEYFGAKTIPKTMKPGGPASAGEPPPSSINPEKRQFLANTIFDILERAFEPQTVGVIHQDLRARGHEVGVRDVEDILQQDLHGFARVDKDGVWHAVSGATQKRREKARAESRARTARSEKQAPPPPPPTAKSEKISEPVAYEILGLRPGATSTDARKKYRALLKRYHPDKFHDDPEFRSMAEQKAMRINMAWEILKDKFPAAPDEDDDE
ncbi:hypothetical protein BH09SUM1_BH09SUM1_18370 [soil metagenome]